MSGDDAGGSSRISRTARLALNSDGQQSMNLARDLDLETRLPEQPLDVHPHANTLRPLQSHNIGYASTCFGFHTEVNAVNKA